MAAMAVLTSVLLRCPYACAQEQAGKEDAPTLEERIRALEARVGELEQRLGRAAQGAERPGHRKVARPDESPISVRLTRKEFREEDLLSGEVGEKLMFDLDFTSSLDRPIRAFSGSVVFRDVLDREVLRASLTCAQDLKPHETVRWRGTLRYQQFDEKHRRLRSLEIGELETDFILERVSYSDGSRDVFADAEESKSVRDKLIPVEEQEQRTKKQQLGGHRELEPAEPGRWEKARDSLEPLDFETEKP